MRVIYEGSFLHYIDRINFGTEQKQFYDPIKERSGLDITEDCSGNFFVAAI